MSHSNKKGLTTEEVAQRLQKFGYNELNISSSRNILQLAYEVVKEPMFLLLLGCGTLYFFLSEWAEGIILLSWVFVIIFITFYQNRKTEKALESLKKLSSPRALVIRNEIEERIPGREIVPDDLVLIHEGDRIPADGYLIESSHLSIDESILTGESLPVSKLLSSIPTMVYSGTLAVQGRALIKVSHTGLNTSFGKIGKSLQTIEIEQTKLQKEIKSLIKKLFYIGGGISLLVIFAFYLTRGNMVQALLNGLATAMAMLPEEFPVVLSVFLAIGAWRLSGKNLLTRKSSAIETLGSATVLCSDKTGTITQNKMEVVSIYTNSILITKEQFTDHKKDIEPILKIAFYASHKQTIDPMEKAIKDCEWAHQEINQSPLEITKEYAFSNDLTAMTHVVSSNEEQFLVCCKGAPETIFNLCKLPENMVNDLLKIVHQLAQKGQRVLGVAHARWDKENVLPDEQIGFNFSLIGLIGFEDPIRPEVPKAIEECMQAGIKVIIITGDFPTTARSIAEQAGLVVQEPILTGSDLLILEESELQEKIKTCNLFARIVPEQKLRIIKALKANGEVVAMTGDGINDAPALKAADIGISMGAKGTDVAREASSMVLLDDNFSSIVAAIRAGRKIMDNLQKAMTYILAIHTPIIGLTLIPAFVPFFPILLMPLHIVMMELIIDPVCSIAFESEKEELNIMNRLPRNPNESFFGIKKILKSTWTGILLLIAVIAVYISSIYAGHSAGETRALTFSTMIFGNLFLIISTLSNSRNAIEVIKEKNKSLIIILITASSLLFLMLLNANLRFVFSFDFPGWEHLGEAFIAAFVVLIILESFKWRSRIKLRKSLLKKN
jgi:Ca2+-transporting ATPase